VVSEEGGGMYSGGFLSKKRKKMSKEERMREKGEADKVEIIDGRCG
jgi:hypothetical protein